MPRSRTWWLAFLGLFVPLALPPLLLAVFPRSPDPLPVAIWLWADLFGAWSGDRSPAEWAVLYTALAAAFATAASWLEARYARRPGGRR